MAKRARQTAARRKVARTTVKPSNPPVFNRLDPVRVTSTGEIGTVTSVATYDAPTATEYLIRFPGGMSIWLKCSGLAAV